MTSEAGSSRRVQRVEREIREILGFKIITDLKGELRGLVTVTRVRVAADLKLARVYISVLGAKSDSDHNLEILEERAPDLQRHLGAELQTKFCPKLSFFIDDTTDHLMRVQSALREIEMSSASQVKPVPSTETSEIDRENSTPDSEE